MIDQETKKFIGYAKKLTNLEMNFRKYISEKGLNEESYRLAANEYSEFIKPLMITINGVENQLVAMSEESDFVNQEMLDELNRELGRLWRVVIANKTFCDNYGGVSFTKEPSQNLYNEIYDKHLEELKEFMFYFVKIANILFSK